jgi:hypothetical protein
MASSTASGATLRSSSATSPCATSDADALGDLADHADEVGDLMLGQQADLQVEIGALVGRGHHPVLADQHEGRQEDGLDARDHRQHDEALVPRRHPGDPAQIGDDPGAEQHQMEQHEGHRPGEAGDRVGDALGQAALLRLHPAPLAQRLDIPPQRRVEAVRIGLHHWALARAKGVGNVHNGRLTLQSRSCCSAARISRL